MRLESRFSFVRRFVCFGTRGKAHQGMWKALAGTVVSGCEFILGDLAAECVAVNAESLRGTGLVAIGAVQDALDEALFEFFHSLVK